MCPRTIAALFAIICTSAVWNVKAAATTTEMTSTEGYSNAAASVSTTNFPTDAPAETTLSPFSSLSPNSRFNYDTTAAEHSTELSLVTTPVKNSPEAGFTTTDSSTSSVSVTGQLSSTAVASTTLLSSVAASGTGDVSRTVKKSNNTTTVLPTHKTSNPKGNTSVTVTFPVEPNATLVLGVHGRGMKYSERVLTSIFSAVLVVALLTILAFGFNKYRKRRAQYSHHPLLENVYESEGYSPPNDTLVISGGLYDAPRIYNPNMTVLEEDDSQHDCASFSSRPGQFRLEFLHGDKNINPVFTGSLRRNV